MKSRDRRKAGTRLRGALTYTALGCVVWVAAGCQFVSEFKVSKQLFRQNILACTQAINRGDLVQAEIYLSSARPLAKTESEQVKLRSLETLIAGAEALMEGDGRLAEAHWSRIEDPILRHEIRSGARQIDLNVPLGPVTGMGGGQ